MKVAFYGRVSSHAQAEDGSSIPYQLSKVEEYCKARGYRIVERYEDAGCTGTTEDRPRFRQMLQDARLGLFEGVATYDLSRWSRATGGTVVKDELRNHGIKVIFVSENLGDTEDPFEGEFVEDVLAANAKAYSRKLSREIPGRMRAALTNGGKGHGGKPPFGYMLEWIQDQGKPSSRQVPNLETAPLVLKAFELYASGASTRDVANFLEPYRGRIHPTNITRFLRNPTYTGTRRIGMKRSSKMSGRVVTTYQHRSKWALRENAHEGIVPREVFDAVQVRLDRISAASQRTRSQDERNPFPQGLLRCANCGSVAEFHKNEKPGYTTSFIYMCRRRRDVGAAHDTNEGCSGSITLEKVKDKVLGRIATVVEGDVLHAMLSNYNPTSDPRIALEEKAFAKQERTLSRWKQVVSDGDDELIPDAFEGIKKANKAIAEIQERLRVLRSNQPPKFDPEAIMTDARSIRKAFERADITALRLLLGKIISEVRIDFRLATKLRVALRTIGSKKVGKSKASTFEAKRAAHSIFAEGTFYGGPITFRYRWEPAEAILREKHEKLLDDAEAHIRALTLQYQKPDF
jgi:DNA invertase Pin-like site-specific DNA recombinase